MPHLDPSERRDAATPPPGATATPGLRAARAPRRIQ